MPELHLPPICDHRPIRSHPAAACRQGWRRFGPLARAAGSAARRVGSRRWLIGWVVTGLGALCLSAAAQQAPAASPRASAAPAQAAASGGAAAPVQTRLLAEAAIRPERDAPAVVLARNESKVAAEVAGRLLRWGPEVGETVAQGALLAEIDPSDHRLARDRAAAGLQAAEARQALARTQLQRSRELVAQGFQSQEAVNLRETELQALGAEIAALRAQLAGAEQQLARTRVTAPFAASVRQRLAQAGEYLAPGTPLYVLVERGGAELSAALPPAELAGLRAAGEWRFEGPGQSLPLRLLRVADTVSAPARTVEVRLAAQAPAVLPPPGSEGRLHWRDPRPHLPAEWVVRRVVAGRSQLGVFVVEAGRARFVPLPGAQEGRAAAAAGLPAQARLVVQGQAALVPGQAVTEMTQAGGTPIVPAR